MSKTVLSEVEGWTPLIDDLTKRYGLTTSAVFGRIWRFCQGEKQKCTASLDTIALDLHLDRATVMRHAKKLCDKGYLSDLTPDARNVPHEYADTGKAGIRISLEGVAQDNTLIKTVAQDNKTVAQSQLKIQERNNSLRYNRAKTFAKNKSREPSSNKQQTDANPITDDLDQQTQAYSNNGHDPLQTNRYAAFSEPTPKSTPNSNSEPYFESNPRNDSEPSPNSNPYSKSEPTMNSTPNSTSEPYESSNPIETSEPMTLSNPTNSSESPEAYFDGIAAARPPQVKVPNDEESVKNRIRVAAMKGMIIDPARKQIIEDYLTKLPERVRELGRAFCYAFGRPPLPEQDKFWREGWDVQATLGLTPDSINQAILKMQREGLTIKAPSSVTSIAENIQRKFTPLQTSAPSARQYIDLRQWDESKLCGLPLAMPWLFGARLYNDLPDEIKKAEESDDSQYIAAYLDKTIGPKWREEIVYL